MACRYPPVSLISPVLTDADVLQHVRPMVLVLDETGMILQAEGTSLSMIGFDADAMIGTNALDYVSPRHFEPIMFVFDGPGDHVMRDRHAPFPLELIGTDGEVMIVDCAAERVHQDGRQVLWVITMMPHTLQSASFHALDGIRPRRIGARSRRATIAERLSWQWDPGSEIRSFLLADPVGRNASRLSTEPGTHSATATAS